MWWFKSSVLLLFLCCAGCDFKPLYRKNADIGIPALQELSHVQVGIIPNREGQIYRNQLRQLLTPYGLTTPLYALKVTIAFSAIEFAFLKDETASRLQQKLTTSYTLTDIKTKKVLTQGSFFTAASYNIVTNADYSTTVAEAQAKEDAILMAAEQLHTLLGLYFARQSVEQPPPKSEEA